MLSHHPRRVVEILQPFLALSRGLSQSALWVSHCSRRQPLYERLVTCVFFHIYEIQRLWRGRGVRCHVEACQGGQLVPHEQVN